MAARSKRSRSARRRNRRYIVTLVSVRRADRRLELDSGITPPARRRSPSTAGARARPRPAASIAAARRSIGGYPFRIEVNCHKAAALLRTSQPPVEIKAGGMLIAAQIYQPNLLITEFHGPLTIADPGKSPFLVVNWKLAQSSVRGTPAAPERVSIALDKPVVERIAGGGRHVGAARPARGNPRPHRRRLGRRQAGDRNGAPPHRGVGARAASGGGRAVRRRHHRGALRLARFRAQALAGAVPRDAGGGRAHRHHASAAAAGRDHRGRRRQPVAQRQRAVAGPVARHRRRDRAIPRVVGAQQTVQASPEHGQGRRRARPAGCPGWAMPRASRRPARTCRLASICSASRPRSKANAR